MYDEAIDAFPGHPGQPPGAGAGAPGTGAHVLPQGAGRAGTAALRAGVGGRPAGAGGGQHPAIPGGDARPQAPERLFRRRHRPGQQPQRRLGERDHLPRHGVRAAALPARRRHRRPLRLRPVDVGRRRVPAAAERAIAAAGGLRRSGAGVSRRRLRPDLSGGLTPGRAGWRARSRTSACWPPRSGSGWGTGRTSTRPACAWKSTAC